MNLEIRDYSADTKGILGDGFDCIWILLRPRSKASPLGSRALQWIDWKLQGQVSRFLIQTAEGKSAVTFFHVMRRLPVTYVAVESGHSCDYDAFRKNCEGLKASKVLLFAEDPSAVSTLHGELKALSCGKFPELTVLGYEHDFDDESCVEDQNAS